MPDPTLNLTAEEFTRHVVCVANPCCLDEEVEFAAARKNVHPLLVEHDATIHQKAFEQAARRLDAFVAQHCKEHKNDIGGVVGYTLSLDVDQTRELWSLLAKEKADAGS